MRALSTVVGGACLFAATAALAAYATDEPLRFAHRRVGSGSSVALVQAAAGAPNTSLWRQGIRVKTAPAGVISVGTVIATFNPQGHFASKAGGAALYLGHDEHGLKVLIQLGQGPAEVRTLRYLASKDPLNPLDGDKYYVVE